MDVAYVSYLLKKTYKIIRDKEVMDGHEVLLSDFIKLQLSHEFNKNDLQREMLLFKNKIETQIFEKISHHLSPTDKKFIDAILNHAADDNVNKKYP